MIALSIYVCSGNFHSLTTRRRRREKKREYVIRDESQRALFNL